MRTSANEASAMREDVTFVDSEFGDQINVSFGPRAGFYFRGYETHGVCQSTNHLIVPYWFAAAIMIVMPGARCWAMLRKWSRRRDMRCSNCGYDLRATPLRCPECGNHPGTG